MAAADVPAFLVELEDRFNAAMVSNDSDRIAACITCIYRETPQGWRCMPTRLAPVAATISRGTDA